MVSSDVQVCRKAERLRHETYGAFSVLSEGKYVDIHRKTYMALNRLYGRLVDEFTFDDV